MVGDPFLKFTKSIGSEVDKSAKGLGMRSNRYTMLVENEVLKIAEKIAKIPSDLEQMNKRSVHRQMELMGMRAAIRQGTEIQALAFHTKSTRAHFKELAAGLTDALSSRDGKFGDYRTSKKED